MTTPTSPFGGLDLVDVEEIRQLLHRFMVLHDHRRDAEAIDLFDYSDRDDDDGFLFDLSALGGGANAVRLTSREQFVEFFRRENQAVAAVAHMVLNAIIEGTQPGRARATAYMLSHALLSNDQVSISTILTEDDLVRTDAGWRFRVRRFSQMGPAPVELAGPGSWGAVGEAFSSVDAE